LRVLLTSPGCNIGGATMAIFNIALGLAKKEGVEVHLVTLAPARNFRHFFKRLKEAGVNIHIMPLNAVGILHWLLLSIAAFIIILKYKINIVNIHNPKEIAFIGIPTKLIRRKVVMTVEGEPLYEMEWQNINIIQRLFILITWLLCLRSADILIPCSNWLAKVIALRYKTHPKIRVIHNPIDWDRYSSAVGDQRVFNFKKCIVFTAARLVNVKAIDILIKAAPIVIKNVPSVSFFIAGDGPARKELETLVEKLGIKNHFSFLGFRSDVEKLMASCDVVVLPSIYEPFGMPAAEAGACKKPVVVSKVGGLPEIVIDGITGLVVPCRDHNVLANALTKLLLDKELSKKMGELGHLRVRKFFTPKVIAEKYLQVYKELLIKKNF
jgi:glycosyltransferase involved in cell wall biosynthesis